MDNGTEVFDVPILVPSDGVVLQRTVSPLANHDEARVLVVAERPTLLTDQAYVCVTLSPSASEAPVGVQVSVLSV